jgi:hypothetical protein
LLIVFKAANQFYRRSPPTPDGSLRFISQITEMDSQVRRSLQNLMTGMTRQSQPPYVCDFPGCIARSNGRASYSDPGGLKRHQLVHNPKATRWICGSCDKETVRKDHLLDHLRTVHNLPKDTLPLSCSICSCDLQDRKEGRRKVLFITQASLYKHLIQEHEERLSSIDESVDNFHASGLDMVESEFAVLMGDFANLLMYE